jgi:hypothetical protein
MADYFAYVANSFGSFSPAIFHDTDPRIPGANGKLRLGRVEKLEPRHAGWSLRDCMDQWPNEVPND